MFKTEFYSNSPWQAAYLIVMGVRLLRCEPGRSGKAVWVFENGDDDAWQLGRNWYNRRDTMVDGFQFMQAYKECLAQAHAVNAARNGSNEQYGNGTAA